MEGAYSFTSFFLPFFTSFASISHIFSASADKTMAAWDIEAGQRIKRCVGHTSIVNSCFPAKRGPPLVATGSDDATVKVSTTLRISDSTNYVLKKIASKGDEINV